MKYPQLVSTRAVNAISDWLVSRLEQLGVEAPQIYTRLLLSLLQSTIQLNDPIEFSNLESFFASRKGGNRRYLDTDALKKFNAVQCLKDIVSSEQEIATIENLVDELCEKLKDIEKQTGDSEDEDKQLVATLSLTQQHHHNQSHHHYHHSHSHKSHYNHQTKEVPSHSKSCSASGRGEGGKTVQAEATAGVTPVNNQKNVTEEQLEDRELDPRDLYFRAFPALSKEMEDSLNWRRNSKWLTWPMEQRNQDPSISTSSSSSTISSNSAADSGIKDIAASSVTQTNARDKLDEALKNASKVPRQELCDDVANVNYNEANASAFASANAAVGGIKRKSKRRRSRALSKLKSSQQNVRKNPATSVACGSASISMPNNGGNNASAAGAAIKTKRSASPTYWDTDFEGCWEMGRDLIKEFITRQNRNYRNRSTSESAVAYNKKIAIEVAASIKDGDHDCHSTNENVIFDEKQQQTKGHTAQINDIESDKDSRSANVVTPILPPVDFSFCDDYDDTLASVSELTNDVPLVPSAKRLYERELIPTDAKSDEQLDFAQFEAKFNSSVEALWKDAGSGDEKGFEPIGNGNQMHAFGFGSTSSSHFPGLTSLPFDVPFSQNVKNFWANYYNHHFDLSKMLSTSVIGGKARELNVVMQSKANDSDSDVFKTNNGILSVDTSEKPISFSKPQADVCTTASTSTSDYYSMPSNLDRNKAKLQRCGLRHNSACSDNGAAGVHSGGIIGEERKTPIALFLQNSIWSKNANLGGGDTDESFYFKVHNSGKQLNQYDGVGNNNNREQKLQGDTDTSAINVGSSSSFGFTAPYTSSKWSEGINAGPPQSNMTMAPPQQLQQAQCANPKNNFNISLNSLSGTDCTDSSSSASLPATTGTNWQAAKGNTKTGLQNTWATSAPLSVEQTHGANTTKRPPTHLISGGGDDGNVGIVTMPKITLANHSPKSSGFIEYSRVKSVLQLQLVTQEKASSMGSTKQLQRNYPQRLNSKEQPQQHYALDLMDDGENLLTSERTHFHPIKSYVDGHTFDICSDIDVVEYDRSASGYLYLEQDKYLEYTRTDNFIVEDDGGVGASANPLYANSNCEAATFGANVNYNIDSGNGKSKRVERDFIIKFRVQRTEIACQTDAEPPTERALVTANKRFSSMSVTATAQPHPLSLIFSNAAKNLKATAANELVYSDTVEAFTRAMAHFPPLSPTSNNSAWLPVGADFDGRQSTNGNWNIYQEHSKMHKKTNKKRNNMKSNANDDDDVDDEAGGDEVDFYGGAVGVADMDHISTFDTDVDMTSLGQQWSMNEIRKKCKEAGHMTTYTNANNNNSIGSGDGADGGIESVWDMCTACNSELKSIPANRLLRDELQVEADEIMSDLKYMQDLYIGRAGDANDADDEDDGADGESVGDTVTSDSDWCAEDVSAEVVEECPVQPRSNEQFTNPQAESTHAFEAAGESGVTNDSETFTVIQKVNRLIAELLRPENNDDNILVDKLESNAKGCEGSRAAETETATAQFSGNLWHSNRNERNIWQLNAADTTTGIVVGAGVGINKNSGGIHPMQLLRQFNVKPIESAANIGNIFPLPPAGDTDKYHTQMGWDHENLARIWQTSPPPPHQQPQVENMAIKNANSPAAAFHQTENHEKIDIAEKNMRNLRANADASVEAAAANLQQAQEFLAHNQSNVIESDLKLKAVTRKRRHSASQNYFHAQLNGGIMIANATTATSSSIIGGSATLFQNNNNNEIANLNSYAVKSSANEFSFKNLLNASLRFGAAAAAAVAASNAKKCSDYATNLCGADIAYGCDATAAAANNHTIITCKYHLTAIEPLPLDNVGGMENVGLFGGGNGGGITEAPLSCLIDKNPSILKHVTMVSRPLTR